MWMTDSYNPLTGRETSGTCMETMPSGRSQEQRVGALISSLYCLLTNWYRLILMYLVPCHIVTTHTLPSEELLAPFPRLERLFRPLCDCIRKGDLGNFDAAMSAGEDEFVKRRIYLPLERGRDIALRNLFRKVFVVGGFEEPKDDQPPMRRTRVPVAEFAAAVRIGTHANDRTRVDIDEVECLLSNLIYKVSFAASDLHALALIIC